MVYIDKRKAIFMAFLLGFELFNFATSKHSLTSMLGDVAFLGFRWSTWLALAMSFGDFAGIAESANKHSALKGLPLFGAWFLSAMGNCSLTWYSVAGMVTKYQIANGVYQMPPQGAAFWLPIAVAGGVLIVRIILITIFTRSLEGD